MSFSQKKNRQQGMKKLIPNGQTHAGVLSAIL